MANSARLGLTASLCQDLLPGGCRCAAYVAQNYIIFMVECTAKKNVFQLTDCCVDTCRHVAIFVYKQLIYDPDIFYVVT